jgi:hypothetical protein
MALRLPLDLSILAPQVQMHPLEKVVCLNSPRTRGAVFDVISRQTR